MPDLGSLAGVTEGPRRVSPRGRAAVPPHAVWHAGAQVAAGRRRSSLQHPTVVVRFGVYGARARSWSSWGAPFWCSAAASCAGCTGSQAPSQQLLVRVSPDMLCRVTRAMAAWRHHGAPVACVLDAAMSTRVPMGLCTHAHPLFWCPHPLFWRCSSAGRRSGRGWGDGESLWSACGLMTATPLGAAYLLEGIILSASSFLSSELSGENLDHDGGMTTAPVALPPSPPPPLRRHLGSSAACRWVHCQTPAPFAWS